MPCARIFGNKTDKYIQKACKMVLTASMQRKDRPNDEMALIIDQYGKVLFKIMGHDGMIDTSSDEYFICANCNPNYSLIFIHNHPNNSRISCLDIASFLGSTSLGVMIAVANNGTVHYIVKTRHDDKYYTKLSMAICKKIAEITKTGSNSPIESIATTILKSSDKYGIRYAVSNRRRF